MANRSPDRTGLIRYYTHRRLKADVVVHRTIVRLPRRTDIPPSKATRVLIEALRSTAISQRTIQRYWQHEIAALRQTFRERYRPPKTRPRYRMLAALARNLEPLANPKTKFPPTNRKKEKKVRRESNSRGRQESQYQLARFLCFAWGFYAD
ncbi:MAG: hypothetical protein V3T60_17080 [Candidatus Binatia bacterium]